MPKLNLRKQQIELLRIEKRVEDLAAAHGKGETVKTTHIAGVMAAIAALTSQAAAKMDTELPIAQMAALKGTVAEYAHDPAMALNSIYEALVSGHAAIETVAVDAGHMLLPNASGVPKRSVESLEGVSRLLGIF